MESVPRVTDQLLTGQIHGVQVPIPSAADLKAVAFSQLKKGKLLSSRE